MELKNNALVAAPLAGITDQAFRTICRECGADIVFSEMVSAEGILFDSRNTMSLLTFSPQERPIGIQLFGSNPEHMGRAAAIVQERFRPDFIDLNAGCPVPKVVRKNGGASLLRQPDLFEAIVRAIVMSVSIPVTVKIRSGWVVNDWVDLDFARRAEDAGAAAVTLHPRSKTMGFSGHSFWERIALVKAAVRVPVIGNGDVISPDDAVRMFRETGCDGVMIGRGACGNPWVFEQARAALEGGPHREVARERRLQTALRHIALSRDLLGESRAAKEMKKHVAWYTRGTPGSALIRDRVFRSSSTAQLEQIVEQYFGSGAPEAPPAHVCPNNVR